MQLSDRNCFALAVVIYGVSTLYAIFLRRRGFRRDDWVNYGLLFAGIILHTAAMLKRGFSVNRCPMSNLYEATMFVTWTIVAAYLLLGLWSRLRFLGAFVAPLLFAIGVFALMPALDHHEGRPVFSGGWASMHKAMILLAYGAFGLSAAAGLMYLTQEYDLKHAKLRAVLSRLPSIQRLERTVTRAMFAGFVLLTAGLALGTAYLKQRRGIYVTADAEVVYSLILWLIYLTLLLAHWRFAQRGRRFAWGAVGSFVFLILTFWGVFLLSGIHHPAQPPAAPPSGTEPPRPAAAVSSQPRLGWNEPTSLLHHQPRAETVSHANPPGASPSPLNGERGGVRGVTILGAPLVRAPRRSRAGGQATKREVRGVKVNSSLVPRFSSLAPPSTPRHA